MEKAFDAQKSLKARPVYPVASCTHFWNIYIYYLCIFISLNWCVSVSKRNSLIIQYIFKLLHSLLCMH